MMMIYSLHLRERADDKCDHNDEVDDEDEGAATDAARGLGGEARGRSSGREAVSGAEGMCGGRLPSVAAAALTARYAQWCFLLERRHEATTPTTMKMLAMMATMRVFALLVGV